MRYVSYFVFIVAMCFSSAVLAGGSDGSEVLGPVGGSKKSLDATEGDLSVTKGGGANGDSGDNINMNAADGTGSREAGSKGKSSSGSANADGSTDGNTSKANGRRKPGESESSSNVGEDVGMQCEVTPAIQPDTTPLLPIKKTGNLLRKPGAPTRARGNYIQVVGKIVDEDCLPISNAIVEMWQTDSAGKYEDEYTLHSEWDVLDDDFDKNFGYSGRAETNNLGEFRFLTIFPGEKGKLAPHLNITITHPDFEPVKTMMFFNKHPKNETDPNLKSLDESLRARTIAKGESLGENIDGREYEYRVTLRGINKYRRY